MKIKIEEDRIAGFHWSIWFNDTRVTFGYGNTYQEAEKNTLAALVKMAKDIKGEIKMHKRYQKKPFKAFRWFGEKYDGIVFTNGRSSYRGTSISHGDWILPETGEVIVDQFFQRFFEEVE